MHLRSDAVFPKQRDKHVGISARTYLVPCDGHHLVNWGMEEMEKDIGRERENEDERGK